MTVGLWLAAAATVLGTAAPSDACDLALMLPYPTSDAVRVTGVVIGYMPLESTPSLPIPILPQTRAGALRLAIREVVSGPVKGPEAVISLQYYDAACQSFAAYLEGLEQTYPIGSTVAVRGRATGSVAVQAIAETNRMEFVANIPARLVRTSDGDLDFSDVESIKHGYLSQFEFDRVVLQLSTGRARNAFARLSNLAASGWWESFRSLRPPELDGRQRFDELIARNRLTARQRMALLKTFDTHHPNFTIR